MTLIVSSSNTKTRFNLDFNDLRCRSLCLLTSESLFQSLVHLLRCLNVLHPLHRTAGWVVFATRSSLQQVPVARRSFDAEVFPAMQLTLSTHVNERQSDHRTDVSPSCRMLCVGVGLTTLVFRCFCSAMTDAASRCRLCWKNAVIIIIIVIIINILLTWPK